jgi:tetratricopeptide (TPR) repeat protein
MKKYLLFIPLLLLLGALPASAQDDVAMQVAEGSLMAKNYVSAETNFSKYIKSISDKLPAYLQKAQIYDTSSPFQRNFKYPDFTYQRKWSEAFYERGLSRLYQSHKDSAHNDFETAIKIDPTYPQPYCEAGILIKETGGDKTKGCIYLGKALGLNDTMKKAKDAYITSFCWMCGAEYFKTGKMHVDLKEYKEGLSSLSMAVLICPDSANYLAYRGAAYDGLGKTDSALIDYTAALKRDSSNYAAYYHRAIGYEGKQRYSDAFADLTRAINMNPNFVDAYRHRAEDSENMGKESSAQYDYKQIIRLKPDDGEAYYKIGVYLKNAGQDACDYFQKALERGYDDAQSYVDDCKKEASKQDHMR